MLHLDPKVTLVFKQPEDAPKVLDLDFRLHILLDMLSWYMGCRGTYRLMVTDIDTPGVHLPNGPHYRKQAIDLSLGVNRQWYISYLDFGKWVNSTFDYGRGYKVALIGPEDPDGRHDDHIHLQIPYPYLSHGRLRMDGITG